MKFVGADLHKKSITLCVMEKDMAGKLEIIARKRLLCDKPDRVVRFLADHTPCELVVEATIGFDWFAALAETVCERVVVAHATKMRVIAESTRKTDKIDARILAEFLAHDMIPESWRATPRVRQHRTLTRYRTKLTRRSTSLRNTMRGILTRYNADRKDLFTRTGWQAAMQLKLHEEERWVLKELKAQLEDIQDRKLETDLRLGEFAHSAPLREQEARQVLASMPGVGFATIEVILAELGDWRRFKNGAAVVAFAGLDPGVRSSDETRHNLRISKSGSPQLRWILIQLAHRVKRRSARWEAIYGKLLKRMGNKKATCALARRLLVTIYAMLREGKAYRMPAAA